MYQLIYNYSTHVSWVTELLAYLWSFAADMFDIITPL